MLWTKIKFPAEVRTEPLRGELNVKILVVAQEGLTRRRSVGRDAGGESGWGTEGGAPDAGLRGGFSCIIRTQEGGLCWSRRREGTGGKGEMACPG